MVASLSIRPTFSLACQFQVERRKHHRPGRSWSSTSPTFHFLNAAAVVTRQGLESIGFKVILKAMDW
jgi:hypothetical protein